MLELSIWPSIHMRHGIDMKWHNALDVHRDIAFHGCKYMVPSNESKKSLDF